MPEESNEKSESDLPNPVAVAGAAVEHFKRSRVWWLVVVSLLSLPYLLLMAGGTIWLYQFEIPVGGWFSLRVVWLWLAVSTVSTLVGWLIANRLRGRTDPPEVAKVKPSPYWSPRGESAWEDVTAISERAKEEDVDLNSPEAIWQVIHEVLQTVARRYHPKSKKAELEIPLPHLLHILELVARDLKNASSEFLPGAHMLTLHDLVKLKKWSSLAQRLYIFYRLGRFAVNPLGGTIAELREYAMGKTFGSSTDEFKRWAIGYCVEKAGYYAIQLYSGQLVVDEAGFAEFTTTQSKRDAARDEARGDRLTGEPLRMLVIGQVKAGKSSLINALFGETRAAVDVIPTTRHVDPFVLERDGIEQAIILDTAGYEDASRRDRPFEQLEKQILACDLVLVVSTALTAARDADRRLLDEVRALFADDLDRVMPPVIVALTHIDRLRPLNEWQPPYNISEPSGRKAELIAAAAEAVAADLDVPPEQVVPVCLRPDRIYNVEEGLAPAIMEQLTEAKRVKYLRCLKQYQSEDKWKRLWNQTLSAGRLLWKSAKAKG